MDRFLIAMPSTEYISARTVNCLTKLQRRLHADGIRHEVALEVGTLVYIARNRLANKAVNENFTHVLWMDSDMIFEDDILDTLAFHDKDMVCGVFQSRRPPFESCIFKDLRLKSLERYQEYPEGLFKVAGCGFGCVLMKTDVIRRVAQRFGKPFTPMIDYGEDLAFCLRAAETGTEIWCDPTARVGHIAHVPVYPEDHKAALAARG